MFRGVDLQFNNDTHLYIVFLRPYEDYGNGKKTLLMTFFVLYGMVGYAGIACSHFFLFIHLVLENNLLFVYLDGSIGRNPSFIIYFFYDKFRKNHDLVIFG